MPEIAWRALRFCGVVLAMARRTASPRIMKAGVLVGRATSVRQLRSWVKSCSAAGLRASVCCEPTLAEDEDLGEDVGLDLVRDRLPGAAERLVRSQTVSRVASSGVRPSWVIAALR